MTGDGRERARALERAAERDDELAEVAELMDDVATATQLRASAHRRRMLALQLLDG